MNVIQRPIDDLMGQYKAAAETDTLYSWFRLAIALVVSTIGGIGMWSVVVALPAVQAEFGVARGEASFPYTLTMLGFGIGGIIMGRLADRFGIFVPLVIGTIALAIGFIDAAIAPSLMHFTIVQGFLIGMVGSSVTFGPMMADISHWFLRRRGLAVAICASGNYLSGTIWPPIVQRLIEAYGWRPTYLLIGVFCLVTMLPLSFLLRRRFPHQHDNRASVQVGGNGKTKLGMSPGTLQLILIFAGIACCIAMSMPQVHIVAYCGDLGYGAARGAEMLSLMLGLGVVSRLISGWISDRIGGLMTLLLGSALQAVALFLYLPADGLVSLYVVSGMFGLFQGGIVPSYAIIVREYFSPKEAGTRVGGVLFATLLGMAIGGWVSGAIFDLTGSYKAAFVNGVAWNIVNLAIVIMLILFARRSMRTSPA